MKENQLSRYGALSRTLPMTTGKIFFVAAASDAYTAELVNEYPVDRDGVPRVYVATTSYADLAIQAALDACVANRNDYVLVMPSAANYTLTATLTMSNANVHLICPAGLGADVGANNATRIVGYAGTNAITITASGCEVAGLYIKNANGYSGVSIGAAAHTTHIHHNHFPLIWTSGAQVGAIVANGGTMLNIERNFIFTYTGDSCTCAAGVILVLPDGYLSRVSNNIIIIGNACTATKGIAVGGAAQLINNNYISEAGGSGATGGGTVTAAVSGTASTSFMGNRCAVATGHFSDATGTTGKSYTDNTDGITNGATGGNLTAQLES